MDHNPGAAPGDPAAAVLPSSRPGPATSPADDAGPPAPTGARERALELLAGLHPWAAFAAVTAGLALCWGLVWVTGGSQRAFTHAFYLPIILAAMRFGLRGTLLTSLAAAVLSGPAMPMDTLTGEPQSAQAWITRGVMFLAVGTLVTFTMEARRRAAERQLARDVQATLTPVTSRPVDPALVPLVGEVLAGRFHTVYQPIYALHTGELLGVEALTRMDVAPYRPPDVWFAAARQAGLGTDLEIAAIRSAVSGAGELPPEVGLAVNASPGTLADPRLLAALRDAGREITVEITEHADVDDYERLADRIESLRASGVRIAVDDAGAGIASLRHIVQLAPQVIKLDISLAQGVASSPLRRALAGSLIEFAQQTGAQLLVEGIEDAEDLATWTALGAYGAQGYLIGRPSALPVPAVSVEITNPARPRRG